MQRQAQIQTQLQIEKEQRQSGLNKAEYDIRENEKFTNTETGGREINNNPVVFKQQR